MASIPSFLYDQIFRRLPYPTTSLEGKTYIVTGGNAGIGLETARHFTRLGAAKVIIACRSSARAEEAKVDIEKSTGRTNVVEFYQLDLGSYESVKIFVNEVAKLDRVDGIVENAGIMAVKYALLEGNESTITVNVTSTFLLALLLLPKLREVSQRFNIQPHLAIVSSEVHHFVQLKEDFSPQGEVFNALSNQIPHNQIQQYFRSKLVEVLVTRELVADIERRHGTTDQPSVIINYLNPGFCNTTMNKEDMSFLKRLVLQLVLTAIARTPEVGARTEFHAAVDAKASSHGKYLSSCEEDVPSKWVLSEEGKAMGARLYTELLAKLEEVVPGISKNI